MEIALRFPDSTPLATLDDQYLREALIATLYHVGRLSEKEACQALGVTRRAFEDLLPRFGFSVMPDDPQTLASELKG